MATITFYANDVQIGGGSGLGFYGASFGNSVRVGEYNQTTYITNGAGTAQGSLGNNIKYFNMGSGYVNSVTNPTGLQYITNNLATLNIRFTHDTAVQVQNVTVKIYDRVNENSPASGVTTYLAEAVNISTSMATKGSGDTSWRVFSGVATATGVSLTLSNSPGPSGYYAGGNKTSVYSAVRHDWHILGTATPDSVGSKTQYGLLVTLEYL